MADHERLSVEVVATAHDAAVLAAVLVTLSSIDGRFALYDSFVRKRLGTASNGKVERSLATLATTMRTNFVSSLPVLAAGRILNRNMPTTMDLACAAGLIRIQDAPANLPPDDPARRAWYRAGPLLHAMNGDQPMVRGSLDVEVEEFRACGIAEAFDVVQRLVREERNPAPAGARVVVLDTTLASLPIAEADLGLPWNWRVGPVASVYARNRAGAPWIDVMRPSGRDFPLQPHFGVNRIANCAPSTGTTITSEGLGYGSAGQRHHRSVRRLRPHRRGRRRIAPRSGGIRGR